MKRTPTTILSSSEEEVASPLYSDDSKELPQFDNRVVKVQPKPIPVDDHSKIVCCRMPIHITLELKKNQEHGVGEHSGLLLIRRNSREWKTGTELTWSFFEDPPFVGDEETIIQSFLEWSKICNVKFKRLKDKDMTAQIRIGFDEKDGCWSYVGQSILKKKYEMKKTMNFDCALFNRRNVSLHEIGHTLGFPHEHQNNKSGIKWNVEVVYEYYKALGWDEKTVDHNILKMYEGVHESKWDPESIMNYEFGPNLIIEPAEYREGIKRPETFSKLDRELAQKFYPFPVEKSILFLQVDENGGMLKVKLRKGESKTIQLQFKCLLPEFEVSLLHGTAIDIVLKKGTEIIASGSSDQPIQIKGCDRICDWIVELCLQSHYSKNELPITVAIISP